MSWKTVVEKSAKEWVSNSQKSFHERLFGSIKQLPNKDETTLMEQVGIFLDANTELAVGIVAANLGAAKQFEDQFIATVKSRFADIRMKDLREGK